MSNEIWCVTQYDDDNFNYTPMFFSGQFDAVDYMLKDINEYTDGEQPFEVKAANYNATLETNKFTHKWYISNVTTQIEDLQK